MLQHSRTSSGVKEPTDINVLADEYLRLAYHGLRAKDKSFNATLQTDFDESYWENKHHPSRYRKSIAEFIQQCFLRRGSQRRRPPKPQRRPIVAMSPQFQYTQKKVAGKIEIRVKDNGDGIPQKVLDKIFQPFFTTKPTGQGTGLGLSLSYDIVKAHGGELRVATKEGEGSEFIIELPVK